MNIGRRLMTAAGGKGVSFTYNGNAVSTANNTNYTFTSQPLGIAAADRIVVVGVSSYASAANNRSISGVTIGGVSASSAVNSLFAAAGTSTNTALFYLVVPAGISADIVVSHSAAMVSCGIAVWSLYGAGSSTPTWADTDQGGSATPFLQVDVTSPANSAVLALETVQHTTDRTVTWTGITEQFDSVVEASTLTFSGANQIYPSPSVSMPITVTPDAAHTRQNLAAAAWS